MFKSWTSSCILWAGDVTQLVCLLSMHKVLLLFSSTKHLAFGGNPSRQSQES